MGSRELFFLIAFLLVLATPLTVATAAVLLYRRIGREEGAALRELTLITILFCGLDWLLLWALPRLGLSFGPIWLTQMALLVTRMLVLMAALLLYRPAGRGSGPLALLHALIMIGVLYSFYYEPFAVQVTRLELPAASIAPGQRLRIVQLSDIHVERTTRREREVVERVRELRSDVIVLTGDYLNLSYLRDEQAAADLRWMLGELSAPLGVFAVSGSVERPGQMREELMAGLNITVLDNQSRMLDWAEGEVMLVGVSDLAMADNVENLRRLMADVPAWAYSVLLYHTPDLILEAEKAGVDLALVGHTHGGQIRAPVYGALITFSAFGKRYEQGLYREGETQMYVSRGLGMEGGWAPRARFLAPPEIVVVDLVGE